MTFQIDESLKRQWDKPDVAYALDTFLARYKKSLRSMPRVEFARLIQEAWVLFNDAALQVIRTTLLFSKKRRALIQSVDGLPRETFETRQGIYEFLVHYAPDNRVVLLKNRLLEEEDLYCNLPDRRTEGLCMLRNLCNEDAAIMYGFFLCRWEPRVGASLIRTRLEQLIYLTPSMSQLQDLLEYMSAMKQFISCCRVFSPF